LKKIIELSKHEPINVDFTTLGGAVPKTEAKPATKPAK
jgi:hypothetical protein